jgi:hypothetical protein
MSAESQCRTENAVETCNGGSRRSASLWRDPLLSVVSIPSFGRHPKLWHLCHWRGAPFSRVQGAYPFRRQTPNAKRLRA